MKLSFNGNKKIISVLGLPHSGTTILSNIINSMENAFCLSEPHWILMSNPSKITFDKIGCLKFNGKINDILPAIRRKIDIDNKYCYGGVKETYRPQDRHVKQMLIHVIKESDILLCIYRNPFALYNSHKKTSQKSKINPMPLSRLIQDYIVFHKDILNIVNKIVISLTLEEMCCAGNNNIMSVLNNRFNNHFHVHGKFNLCPTNFIYGNSQANNSSEIIRPNLAQNLLDKEERQIISENILPIYESIGCNGL